MKLALHWFRRDLRLHDNPALSAAAATADRVLPVYILSDWTGGHAWTGPPRQEFLCGCLRALDASLLKMKGRLHIRRGRADEILRELFEQTGADGVFFNRDPDPFGWKMERRVAAMAKSLGRSVHSFKDAVIHERDEILTTSGQPYRVFTPYLRAWERAAKEFASSPRRHLRTPSDPTGADLPTLATWGLESDADIPDAGEKAARARMQRFLDGPILEYGAHRDMPAAEATSRLSQDLRFGLLSIRELHQGCTEAMKGTSGQKRKSVHTFVSELVWREFYMQILFHFPEVLETDFNPKYRNLEWRESEPDLERWRQGETGFPIVDAGMRQLHATGFLHNRLRMIVAMFLTKDLRIHWKEGEIWFMQRLVDGEISSNNGGWQWSAGTGADAAPYFRIQNPWTQTKRHDPEGAYIKSWVSELRDVPTERFFGPPPGGERLHPKYPRPVVDHAEAREAALEMFKR